MVFPQVFHNEKEANARLYLRRSCRHRLHEQVAHIILRSHTYGIKKNYPMAKLQRSKKLFGLIY